MSERYSKLFLLAENLYASGSPVIISAGALLKDNHENQVLAQLKLRNITNKAIKAVKVRLNLFDTAGRAMGEPVLFDYLDLNVSRDIDFGQKTPVPIAENTARSYTVSVEEVVFADHSTWVNNGEQWEPLPCQRTLDSVLRETELIKQYHIAVGGNFNYFPLQEKDVWFCVCGAINRADEPCHNCRRIRADLQTISEEQLAKDKEARLAEEARKDAEAKAAMEAKAAANAAKAKKVAKNVAIVIPIAASVIAAGIFIAGAVKKNNDYKEAAILLEMGEYQKAITAFQALDGYKDSADLVLEAEAAEKYQSALELSSRGKYYDAISIFKELDGYSDSTAQIVNAYFLHAEKMMKDGEYASLENDLKELRDRTNNIADIDRIGLLTFSYAKKLYEEKSFLSAIDQFEKVSDNQDSNYYIGMCYLSLNKFENAKEAFEKTSPKSQYYKFIDELISECQCAIDYNLAVDLCQREKYSEALALFMKLGDYKNSDRLVKAIEDIEKADFAGIYHNGDTYLQIIFDLEIENSVVSYTVVYQDDTLETRYSNAYVDENGNLVFYLHSSETLNDNKTTTPIEHAEYRIHRLGFVASGRNPWESQTGSYTFVSKMYFEKTSLGVTECTVETTRYYSNRSDTDRTVKKQFQLFST